MRFTFDLAKNEKNIAERGLSFELAAELEWETALTVVDTRHDYGETGAGASAWTPARRRCHAPRGRAARHQLQESKPKGGKTL
jgi:uncharacterized DUF497 family protein